MIMMMMTMMKMIDDDDYYYNTVNYDDVDDICAHECRRVMECDFSCDTDDDKKIIETKCIHCSFYSLSSPSLLSSSLLTSLSSLLLSSLS